jgi:hypothetical protein
VTVRSMWRFNKELDTFEEVPLNATARLMEALNNGPKQTAELDYICTGKSRLRDIVHYANVFNERIGSHWRVRTTEVDLVNKHTGLHTHTNEYRLVQQLSTGDIA